MLLKYISAKYLDGENWIFIFRNYDTLPLYELEGFFNFWHVTVSKYLVR